MDRPIAIKLDFDESDDNEEIFNSSMEDNSRFDISSSISVNDLYKQNQYMDYSLSSIAEHSPPYKRIRALRLFDSPATPKTLLQKCAADSTSSHNADINNDSPQQFSLSRASTSGLSSRIRPQQGYDSKGTSSQHDIDHKQYAKIANVNPFTPQGIMMSIKRTKRDTDANTSHYSDMSYTSDSHIDESEDVVEVKLTEKNSEENLTSSPNKRISIYETNLSRYHEEFVEIERIGQGKFGSVYKCRHRLDGCIYAIKKSLKPVAGSANERIALNEVYAHAVLGKHIHVVRYYSAWAQNNHMIIQNEYCNGGSLAELIEQNKTKQKTFREAQLKQLLLHITKGLKYIHSQQLVHMDIKPENIFITMDSQFLSKGDESADDGFDEEDHEDSEQDITYKIGDLGHVTSIVYPQVEEGDCRYLPREILQEDFTHLCKADIFALGLTLYELASRKTLPLNGILWHALRDGHFEAIENLSNDLQFLLISMTHPDPQQRPMATDLLQQLSYRQASNKSQVQLRKELDAEKCKNEFLSSELAKASKLLESLDEQSPDGCMTTGKFKKVIASYRQSNATAATRKPRSRIVGRMTTRSSSNLKF